MAVKCHFAHGKEELRSIHDPLPPNTPYITDPKLNKTSGPGGVPGKSSGVLGDGQPEPGKFCRVTSRHL